MAAPPAAAAAAASGDVSAVTPAVAGDDFLSSLLSNPAAERLVRSHVSSLFSRSKEPAAAAAAAAAASPGADHAAHDVLAVGLAAFDAFLQANVTGPVLPPASSARTEALFVGAWNELQSETSSAAAPEGQAKTLQRLRRACLAYLEVDGVSPYAHIPRLELFSLARHIIIEVLSPSASSGTNDIVHLASAAGDSKQHSLAWTALRLNSWHYKIITQPSLGPGSNFNRSSQWIDVPSLATKILDGISSLRARILDVEVWADEATETAWSPADKALFLIETASNYISLGQNEKAKGAIAEAVSATGFTYALSGALGKRTKFQERDISQLVVLAKSADGARATDQQEHEQQQEHEHEHDEDAAKPDALKLNDDTLLEEIHFAKASDQDAEQGDAKAAALPSALLDLAPNDQPQLDALDEMILLTEATIKDAFSPVDTLTAEQILPFAVRVITDKSVNWQIYSQALLVRSRIELHRSRTVERGVLQLQAVADQVIADTTYSTSSETPPGDAADGEDKNEVPVIRVAGEAAPVDDTMPTTFFPAPKQSETAPASVRLRYIHALSSPPRWHLESELAYSWAGVGSMASALEIFKRLRLWAEVALCLASTAAARDEQGKGNGGEDKARAIIRWRLFSRTGSSSSSSSSPSTEPEDDISPAELNDVALLKVADWAGPERNPPPPDAPRLWCILGDFETNPAHYDRAWAVSGHRFARAQRSLGEHHIQQGDWPAALAAYKLATAANRMSPDMWGRLGDISLRLARFEDAAQAYTRSIGSATDTAGGEGARTWSNLGSALWSLYLERTAAAAESPEPPKPKSAKNAGDDDDDDERDIDGNDDEVAKDPAKLVRQALAAYKKGASIAHDNWRIWENVLTLSTRIRPLPLPDMLLALSSILRIRRSEHALDTALLSALIQDVVLSKPIPPSFFSSSSSDPAPSPPAIYEPPRGSPERNVIRLFEDSIIPLITTRPELWTLLARLRAWQLNYPAAIDASERAWRAAVGSSGSSLLPGSSTTSSSSAPNPNSSSTPNSASGPDPDLAAAAAAHPASRDWTSDKAAWDAVVNKTDELVAMLETYGPRCEAIGHRWKGKARSAVRSVMGRGRETWEGSEGWRILEGIMDGLKA